MSGPVKDYDEPLGDVSWDDFPLREDLVAGCINHGHAKPSIVQQKMLPDLLAGYNFIGQGKSGQGKTATFLVALLNKVVDDAKHLQGLVLAPTRDLALQTYNEATAISSMMNVKIASCVGGTNALENITKATSDAQIIIGTPGRVKHISDQHPTLCENVHTFIMDEADQLMEHGFFDQVGYIAGSLSPSCQIMLFSATYTLANVEQFDVIMDLRKVKNCRKILLDEGDVTLSGIRQYYIPTKTSVDKLHNLQLLLDGLRFDKVIVYVNSKTLLNFLKDSLYRSGFEVATMHGDMTQEERDTCIKQIRADAASVILATNVIARGIDFQDMGLIINYELPSETNAPQYIHRIGRSGRFGRKGCAISLVSQEEEKIRIGIEKMYNTKMERIEPSKDYSNETFFL